MRLGLSVKSPSLHTVPNGLVGGLPTSSRPDLQTLSPQPCSVHCRLSVVHRRRFLVCILGVFSFFLCFPDHGNKKGLLTDSVQPARVHVSTCCPQPKTLTSEWHSSWWESWLEGDGGLEALRSREGGSGESGCGLVEWREHGRTLTSERITKLGRRSERARERHLGTKRGVERIWSERELIESPVDGSAASRQGSSCEEKVNEHQQISAKTTWKSRSHQT